MNSDYAYEAPRPNTRRTFIARDGAKLQRGYVYLPEEVWKALDGLTERHAFDNTSATVAKLVMALAEEQHSAQEAHDNKPNH